MRKLKIILLTACIILLPGCRYLKTEHTTDPYSISYKDVKNLYNEVQLSADNFNNYYEFVTETIYNENTGCNEYIGYLKPKTNIYTFIEDEEISVSYTYEKNIYNCTYDITTGEIVDKGQPISTQPVNVTEYLNPYFSNPEGIISADYKNSLKKDESVNENNRYQQIQLTFNENISITGCEGTLCFFTANNELPWLYTHKAHDAFYGRGNYRFLQIEAKYGYCSLLFSNDSRRNVSARYFFDDGTSSGSLSMKDILNDRYYSSMVTESGQKYILE